MSDFINSELLERAAVCINYFESKMPATLIEQDLASNDMESLRRHVLVAEAEMSIEYFAPGNPERAAEREARRELTDIA